MGFTLTSARIHVRDIKLDLPDGSDCDDRAGTVCTNDTIEIRGPFDIDLMTGVSTPSLDVVRVPAGTYKRIDFRIDDDGALDDRSLVATADFVHQGQPMTLALSLRFNEDVRVEAPQGITVSGDGAALLTLFDATAWLDGLDVAECLTRDELVVDGSTVTVDDDLTSGTGSCSEIENVLKLNIKTAAQLEHTD
jgi:hypothetical protein